MHVVILLGFIVALAVPRQLPVEAVTAWRLIPALIGYFVITALLGVHDAAAALRALAETDSVPTPVLRRHRRMAVIIQGWLVAGLAVLNTLGWRWWIHTVLGIERWPLVGDLLTIGPFVAGLGLMWLLQYPVHRAIRRRMAAATTGRGAHAGKPVPCWSLREYLIFNTRHHLLFIAVPLCLILLGVQVLDLLVFPSDYWPGSDVVREAAYAAGTLAIAGMVFLVAPVLLVRVWRTRPLPAGPLRDKLETLCRRMGVRHREILIWESGGVLANAAAMGLIGPVRYALLSDALLEQMDDAHIQAVFAHEVAHAKKHHILLSAMFAMAAATCCSAVGWGVTAWLALPGWAEQTVVIVLLAAAWVFGFGFISRRFERQCDVIGAWASGPGRPPTDPADKRITPEGAAIFSQALHRVADLNGIPLGQWNWRHGRMADRILYVQTLGMTDGSRDEIDRTVRRIKLLLAASLLVGLSLAGLQIYALAA